MSTAISSIEVHVPRSVAYNQWTQMESYPRFMAGVDSVYQVDDAHTVWRMSMAGVEREFTSTITEQIPDERISWRSDGEVLQAGVVTFEDAGHDLTLVELTLDWEPTGAAEKVGTALQLDDAMVNTTLMRFKELMETQGQEDGAWRGTIPGEGRPGDDDPELDDPEVDPEDDPDLVEADRGLVGPSGTVEDPTFPAGSPRDYSNDPFRVDADRRSGGGYGLE